MKRVCVKDYRLDENFILEAGTEVIIPVSAIQRDPKYFPKPEEFIPERWEDSSLKSSDVYMPFGKGPRICIGNTGFGICLLHPQLITTSFLLLKP